MTQAIGIPKGVFGWNVELLAVQPLAHSIEAARVHGKPIGGKELLDGPIGPYQRIKGVGIRISRIEDAVAKDR